MSRRLLVNDVESCIPGTRTFWTDLREWFGMEFVGGEYATLANLVDGMMFEHDPDEPEETPPSLIIRNASWFPPLKASERVPTISLLQDILEGDGRKMQEAVIASSVATVCNSFFTASKYQNAKGYVGGSTNHPHV